MIQKKLGWIVVKSSVFLYDFSLPGLNLPRLQKPFRFMDFRLILKCSTKISPFEANKLGRMWLVGFTIFWTLCRIICFA